MRKTLMLYLIACIIATTVPLLSGHSLTESSSRSSVDAFPGWPAEFQGKSLTQIPLLNYEQRFYKDFDGKVGRFTDGEHELVIRWMATRAPEFHLSTSCFRAAGFQLTPLPIQVDDHGNQWGSFRARKDDEILLVKERIEDGKNQSWTDDSAWRWDSLWRRTRGPWWAYTIASKVSR